MCPVLDKDATQDTSEHFFNNQVQALIDGNNHSPHELLGLHPFFGGKKVIRIWRPGADKLYIQLFGETIEAAKFHPAGLFECVVPGHTNWHDYKIYHQNGLLDYDPYAFPSTFGELDAFLFAKGTHYQLYNVMGGRLYTHNGVKGAKFAVWAPTAKRVSLVGDFNYFDGRVNPLRSSASGVWELFVPGLSEGEKYKFEIKTQWDEILIKADPYALSSEVRPATASKLAELDRYHWNDAAWIEKRQARKNDPYPMNVYEVHLGSWKWVNGPLTNYRDIAPVLAKYCKELGYTHVEFLPLAEHPLDESWGYQVSGYYAVTSRFGTPEDFQFLVDHFHQHDLGVILDWVPGHFPTDEFSLGRFDGTALYEHADPRQGFHPHWQTHIFNFGRREVSNFLLANALFLFDKLHIDGLRVDAVASMLYLDYGREENEWIPNQYGGKENLDAIEFFKHVNSIAHQKYPGILMIAEESTSFTGVTHPVEQGGLGFNLKWNMGWMNDTLRYFATDMLFRCYHQNDLTFGQLYIYSEKFISVFSHDEVVHGKKSLIAKMPGDYWQKFANLRLLYSYLICQPGKKLTFMGCELAQWNEWYCKREVEWQLLNYPAHKGMQKMVKELNHFYLDNGCLWDRDFDYTGFEWVDLNDSKNCVLSYMRKGPFQKVLCIHNFTPQYHEQYFIALKNLKHVQEAFNTDQIEYGGSGKVNLPVQIVRNEQGDPIGLTLSIAPLATLILNIDFY